jgi:hypothetical protein
VSSKELTRGVKLNLFTYYQRSGGKDETDVSQEEGQSIAELRRSVEAIEFADVEDVPSPPPGAPTLLFIAPNRA